MGWKSTITIKKEDALALIARRLFDNNLSHDEISSMMEAVGYGENSSLPLYGYNFDVVDEFSEYDLENGRTYNPGMGF